jgi:hypothetical protein
VTPIEKTDAMNNARRLGNVLWLSVPWLGVGPTKTAIEPNWRGRLSRVVLRGWRCSDGRPLRFWFSDADLPFRGPGSTEQLATTGSKRLMLRLSDLRRQHHFIVGYFLFSSSGKWVIEARHNAHTQATALFDFPS